MAHISHVQSVETTYIECQSSWTCLSRLLHHCHVIGGHDTELREDFFLILKKLWRGPF